MPVRRKNNNPKKVYGNLDNDDNDDKLLTCFMCGVQENWQNHQKKPEHKSKLQFFADSFVDISEVNVRCKLCKSLVPKIAFQKHASKKHQLIPWHRPEDEFTTFFKNCITKFGDEYHCYLCDQTHSCWYESIEHTKKTPHSKIWKEFTRLNVVDTTELTDKISQQFVTNGIILLNCTQLRCWTCDCVIVGHENAIKHIVSEIHKSNLLKRKELMSQKGSTVSTTVNVVKDQFLTYFENFILKCHDDYYCNLCNNNYISLSMVMSHIDDPVHKNFLSRKRQRQSIGSTPCKPNICELLVKNNIFQFNNLKLKCYSCKLIISSYSKVEDHLNSKNHKTVQNNNTVSRNENNDTANYLVQSPESNKNFAKDLDNFIGKTRDGYCCHLCDIQFSTSSDVMTHLDQQEHIDLVASKEIGQLIIDENPALSSYCPEDHVICKLCNINIPKDSVVEHAIEKHQSKPWLKPDNEFITYFRNFITPKYNYYCYICNEVNKRWYLALEHIKSIKHSDCVKMFINNDDVNQEILSLKQCEMYVNNSVFPFTFTQLRCWKCNYVIDGYENGEKHISSDEHKKHLKNINNSISANEVHYEIMGCNDSGLIVLDSEIFVDDKESSGYEIKTNNSTDQSILSDSLEKSLDINESKESASSGYGSTNTETTIINDSNDDHVNSISIYSTESTNAEENKFLQFFENSIGRRKNAFYCNLCCLHLTSEDKTLAHIDEPHHQLLKKIKFKADKIKIDKSYPPEAYERFIDNFIFPQKLMQLICVVCECSISYADGEFHINDNSHSDKDCQKIDCYLSCNNNISAGTEIVPDIENEDNDNSEVLFKEQNNLADLLVVEAEDQLFKYFENCISKRDKNYYCYLCNKTLALPSLVMEHIDHPIHRHLLKVNVNSKDIMDKVPEISILSELFIKNDIFPYENNLKCFKCKFKILTYEGAVMHIENKHLMIKNKSMPEISIKHLENLPQLDVTTSDNQSAITNSQLINTDLLIDSLKDLNIAKISNGDNAEVISNENQDHAIAMKQINYVPDRKSLSKLEDLYIKYFENCIFTWSNKFYCSLCQVCLFTQEMVTEHMKESFHENQLDLRRKYISLTDALHYLPNFYEILVRNNIFYKEFSSLFCFSCNCSVGQYKSAEGHINSRNHLSNFTHIFTLSDASFTQNNDKLVPPPLLESKTHFVKYFKNFIEKRRDDYYCHLCQIQLSSFSDVSTHINDKNHNRMKKKSKPMQRTLYFYEMCVRNAVFQKNFDEFHCFTCGHCIGKKHFEAHISTQKHRHKLSSSSLQIKTLSQSEIINNNEPVLDNRISESNFTSIESKTSKSEIILNEDTSEHQLKYELEELFFKCFENYILVRHDDFFCNLCNICLSTSSSVLTHIDDSDYHQNLIMGRKESQSTAEEVLYLPNFIEILVRHNIFLIQNSTLKCLSCECIISGYICAEQHMSGHHHKTNHKLDLEKEHESVADLLLKSQEDFTTYFVNFIEKRRTDYHCHLCHVDLSPSLVMAHVKDENSHVLIKNKKLSSKLANLNYLYVLEMCVRHSLFQDNSIEFKCYKCDKYFELAKKNVEEHVRSNQHLAICQDVSTAKSLVKYKDIYRQYYATSNDQVTITANQVTDSDSMSRILNFSNEPTPSESKDLICKYFNNYIYIRNDEYLCNLCNLTLTSLEITAHLEHPDHQILVIRKREGKNIADMPTCMSDIVEKLIKNNIFQVDLTSLYCFTCSCLVPSVLGTQEHIDSEKHKDNSKSFILKNSKPTFISNDTKIIESESIYHQYFDNFIIKDRSDYFCYVCLKSLVSSLLVNIHMNEENHKIKVIEKKQNMNIMIDIPHIPDIYQKLVRNNIVAHETQNMKCRSCYYVLPSIMDVELHIQSKFHQQTYGLVIIETPGKQDALLTDPHQSVSTNSESISNHCKVLNISQTETKPLISLRTSGADFKESRIYSANLLNREIFHYSDAKKSVVHCVVCYQKLQSRVFLHVHLTNHFWQLFTDKNIRDLMALTNVNDEIKIIINKEENFTPVVPNYTMIERRQALLRYQSRLADDDNSSKNAAVPQQLWVNETENKEIYENKNDEQNRGKKDEKISTNFDIDEDETPKKFDIYEIDKELQYTNQLSLNRIFIINSDNIYCMICRKRVAYSVRIIYEHFRSIEHFYFLMQMVQDHIKFKSFRNELSDLSLAREFMEDKNDRHVVCYVCDPIKPIIIPNTNDALRNHVNQHRHLKSKCKLSNNLREFKTNFHLRLDRNWSNTNRYWCVICSEQFKFEKSFYTHLNSKNHHKKCEKYLEFENFVCDFCPTCGLLFYGFKNTFTYHSECKFHQYYADRTFYLITRLPAAVEELLVNAEEIIASKMEAIDLEISLMKHEGESLINDLKDTIKNYVEATIYPFGSRVSGLGTINSDLDIFLDCDNLYIRGTDKTDTSMFLREVEHALNQNEDIWTIKRTILDSRIPIIKITHRVTSIDCDLSFVNGLTVENSKLVRSYVDKFPMCRKLVLFIKDWINISNLGDENGFCSYAVAWMVIYYLQTKFILPNVATLIKLNGKSRLIGGWETGASTDFPVTNSDYNFKDLLRGFFIMCAGFDYRNNIICPLLGYPVKKLDIVKPVNLTNLPDEMKPYKNYLTKNKKAQKFSLDSVIAVQDPYDLSNNLTKAVKKSTMYRFKTFCSLSAEKLKD